MSAQASLLHPGVGTAVVTGSIAVRPQRNGCWRIRHCRHRTGWGERYRSVEAAVASPRPPQSRFGHVSRGLRCARFEALE